MPFLTKVVFLGLPDYKVLDRLAYPPTFKQLGLTGMVVSGLFGAKKINQITNSLFLNDSNVAKCLLLFLTND